MTDDGTVSDDGGTATGDRRTATVQGTVVDPATPGGWCPDVDTRLATLERPVRDLLEADIGSGSGGDSLATADRITIVPDAHYPFHPSSGIVTDPAVVGSIVATLERRTDADIAVAGRSDDVIAFDRTAEYLGYRSLLERFDASLVDLAGETHTDTRFAAGEETVTASVPSRLARSPVVVVPSLRPTESGPIAGGLRTIGSMLEGDDGDEREDTLEATKTLAATRSIEPALSVLDATTVYGGEPYAANALFAGPAAAVDAVGTSLLERSIADDDVLRCVLDGRQRAVGDGQQRPAGDDAHRHSGAARQRSTADGRPAIAVTPVGVDAETFDLEALRAALPTGDLPPSDGTHPAVTAAYRLYATVSGDAVPPQLEGGE